MLGPPVLATMTLFAGGDGELTAVGAEVGH